jgi:hypothetical protein
MDSTTQIRNWRTANSLGTEAMMDIKRQPFPAETAPRVLLRTWAQALEAFEWSWQATLTCGPTVSQADAARRVRRWIDAVQQDAFLPARWAMVSERRAEQGVRLYVLLAYVSGKPLDWLERWEAIGQGSGLLVRYDPTIDSVWPILMDIGDDVDLELAGCWPQWSDRPEDETS